MPLYMDIHNHVEGLTAEAVAGAHQRDLEVQGKYGANYLNYWFNEDTGQVFCLVDAPSKAIANAVHRENRIRRANSSIQPRGASPGGRRTGKPA